MKIKRIKSATVFSLTILLALTVDYLCATEKGRVVRVGYQKSGALLPVKSEVMQEKKLPPLGCGVK